MFVGVPGNQRVLDGMLLEAFPAISLAWAAVEIGLFEGCSPCSADVRLCFAR